VPRTLGQLVEQQAAAAEEQRRAAQRGDARHATVDRALSALGARLAALEVALGAHQQDDQRHTGKKKEEGDSQ